MQPSELAAVALRISVVIPAHRCQGTIARAVRSVDAQTLSPLEIIVVDNEPGSALQDLLPPTSQALVLVHEPRRGAAFARNAGIGRARGRFCAFLDCDDEWRPDFLWHVAVSVTTHPDALLHAGAAVIESSGHRRFVPAPVFGRRGLTRLALQNGVTTSSAVVRSEDARVCGGFLEGLRSAAGCEDWALWLRLLQRGRAVGVPGAIAIRHRRSSDDRSNDSFEADLRAVIDRVIRPSNTPDLLAAAAAGISLRRGTIEIDRGNMWRARRCFLAAALEYPWAMRTWSWLALALMPAPLGRALKSLRPRLRRPGARERSSDEGSVVT